MEAWGLKACFPDFGGSSLALSFENVVPDQMLESAAPRGVDHAFPASNKRVTGQSHISILLRFCRIRAPDEWGFCVSVEFGRLVARGLVWLDFEDSYRKEYIVPISTDSEAVNVETASSSLQ